MVTATSSVVESPPSPASTRSAPLQRVRSEFLEMPGLSLTLRQAARLCGLNERQTASVLNELVEAGFLVRTARGSYRRRGCPRCS